MKITGHPPSHNSHSTETTNVTFEQRKTMPSAPLTGNNPDADSVNLSARASFLNKLNDLITLSTGIDENRISIIKEQISAGNYTGNYLHVAEKLISLEKSLQ